MQKSFFTQPELFVTSADLEHPGLQGLDEAEAVLDGAKLERLMSGLYASKTGQPSYPLLTCHGNRHRASICARAVL
jgi:IS5 family transposase